MRYDGAVVAGGVPIKLNFIDNLYVDAQPIWEQVGEGKTFAPLNPAEIFNNSNPLLVEIGIGNGEFVAYNACRDTSFNWLGIEAFRPIFVKAVARCKKISHDNIRLVQFDAELFVRLLPEGSVGTFYINFPDPWPKQRHHKRRLLKSWFLELLAMHLADGGSIIVATDHEDYAMELVENFAAVSTLESVLEQGGVRVPYINEIVEHYQTKYYRKFALNGRLYYFNMRLKSK
ncbi:hypothetical protein AGMMS49941_00940 [Deferribacterales bacterium]|nr:hypothetical protein AGMMS49941_00940 [Deferribacterales bacterium]